MCDWGVWRGFDGAVLVGPLAGYLDRCEWVRAFGRRGGCFGARALLTAGARFGPGFGWDLAGGGYFGWAFCVVICAAVCCWAVWRRLLEGGARRCFGSENTLNSGAICL